MKIFFLSSLLLTLTLLFTACRAENTPPPTSSTPEPASQEAALQQAKSSEIVELKNGDMYDLTAQYVNKEINGQSYRMLAYNGSIPGPTLKVAQGSEITVNFKNDTDVPTSIHSHGIRLEDKYDGVVDTHQPAVEKGETFTYKIKFPDVGMFWYHPHVNEPFAQSQGFYGNYWVVPKDNSVITKDSYWSPVNEEIPLMLNDILIEDGKIHNFSKVSDYALMGKFGNTMLVNGDTDFQKTFKQGEVVRFFITNASNTRVYNLSIPNLKIKLVGGDNGKYEREEWRDTIVLSPSERAIIEVMFDTSGTFILHNINPQKSYDLATFVVSEEKVSQDFSKEFMTLRENKEVMADIDNFRSFFEKQSDKNISFTLDMMGMGNMNHAGHMMPNGQMMSNDQMEGHNMKSTPSQSEKIEWEDTMPMMNAMSTSETVKWKMVDDDTKKENMNIDWKFKAGDKVKISIFNDPNSMHPMQHPFHVHGQRFLVLSTNGVKNTNLVWKDTVLVPKGDTVEILVDMSNPGKWMAHCHISEHLESGMMLAFSVD